MKLAKYLINTAKQDKVATMVIEGMGVHKVNGEFVDGAAELLAEKMGG